MVSSNVATLPSTSTHGYPSNRPGQYIVNAETGIATTHRVGSMNENLYFKVANATQRNSTGDADIYFYDSPEHYVRHRFGRMRYRIRSDSKIRIMHDKQRKDEMLMNSENELVHWSLVDSNGAATEDTNKAFMVPFVNPTYMTRWTARKSEQLAIAGVTDVSDKIAESNDS
jgi:hypothetical protein